MMRSFLKKSWFRQKALRQPSTAYCAANLLLPEVLIKTPPNELRKLFGLPTSPYFSQLNQDFFALLLNRFRKGYFLEIGANDGFTLSNTVYLETFFDWTGLLIEPNPKYCESLNKRKANICQKAVGKVSGVEEFVDAGLYGGIRSSISNHPALKKTQSSIISIETKPLKNILEHYRVPNIINFCSVDVEGGELSILEQICRLKTHRIVSGCVEHNNRQRDLVEMKKLLKAADYEIIWDNQTGHDLFFIDRNLIGSD